MTTTFPIPLFAVTRLALLAAPLFAVAIAGCGNNAAQITIKGQSLIVADQIYGTSGERENYCDPLSIYGQFEVLITDVYTCGDMRAKKTNLQIFHGQEIHVLRLIFPGAGTVQPLKVTQANVFQVGRADCAGSTSSPPAAVAYFSHNAAGTKVFDVNVQADSGTISIPGSGYDKNAQSLAGTYDLTFSGQRITGDFNTSLCPALIYSQHYGE